MMQRNFGGKIVIGVAALGSFACLATQFVAIASTSAASPYAVLVPVSAASSPPEYGLATKPRDSSCPWGQRDVPTDFGWRCVRAY
jgi:hypothetical protein